MSVDDIRDLHDRLDVAFATITPAPAPIDGAIRRGRLLRWRRRAAVAASAAAVVAVAVLVPLAAGSTATPSPPAGPGGYTVTVRPPGPHSPAGLVASGTVDGQGWQVIEQKPHGTGPGVMPTVTAEGAAFGSHAGPLLPDDPGGWTPAEPVAFLRGAAGPVQVQYGMVRADISYAAVRFGNGTVLTLHPATVYGIRLVAFAAPVGVNILDVIAYSAAGPAAVSVPLDVAGQAAYFGSWLGPEQLVPPRASGVIASGKAAAATWSASAYVGPWGGCVALNGELNCDQLGVAMGNSVMIWQEDPPGSAVGTAAPAVTRVVVSLPGGQSRPTRPVVIGGQKFFAFGGLPRMKNLRWTAYNVAGRVVASGVF